MSADMELRWEWPADRAVEEQILIKVEDVQAQGSGVFGLGKSPSLAANIPEPTVITGTVQNKGAATDGKSLRIVAPKAEIGKTEIGGYAVLGVVDKAICICIVPVDPEDMDLSQIDCP